MIFFLVSTPTFSIGKRQNIPNDMLQLNSVRFTIIIHQG